MVFDMMRRFVPLLAMSRMVFDVVRRVKKGFTE